MSIKLITEDSLVDNEEYTTWKLDKNDGAVVINLNKALELDITECHWLDANNKFLQIMYSELDSTEHFAIITNNGDLVKKGIKEIHHYIENEELFVALFSGFGLEEDATYYNVDQDVWKMAVFNSRGDYVLTPEYNSIEYYEDEDVFHADDNTYDCKGNLIKQEEEII